MIFKSSKKRGFSVAEAMVTLLLVSIALAAAAPMLSKQAKNNAFSSAQYQLLLEKIENMEKAALPKGMVSFFNIPCASVEPAGEWSDVPTNWQGRYPRIVGSYQICDVYGANCISKALTYGERYDDAIRKITGKLRFVGAGDAGFWADRENGALYVGDQYNSFQLTPQNCSDEGCDKLAHSLVLDTSTNVPTADENRVKTVGLYMCVKN